MGDGIGEGDETSRREGHAGAATRADSATRGNKRGRPAGATRSAVRRTARTIRWPQGGGHVRRGRGERRPQRSAGRRGAPTRRAGHHANRPAARGTRSTSPRTARTVSRRPGRPTLVASRTIRARVTEHEVTPADPARSTSQPPSSSGRRVRRWAVTTYAALLRNHQCSGPSCPTAPRWRRRILRPRLRRRSNARERRCGGCATLREPSRGRRVRRHLRALVVAPLDRHLLDRDPQRRPPRWPGVPGVPTSWQCGRMRSQTMRRAAWRRTGSTMPGVRVAWSSDCRCGRVPPGSDPRAEAASSPLGLATQRPVRRPG